MIYNKFSYNQISNTRLLITTPDESEVKDFVFTLQVV